MANELKALIANRSELRSMRVEIDNIYQKECAANESLLLLVLQDIADHVESDTPKTAPKRRTKKSPPQPDHDRVARQYADFEPAATGCLCGCGEHVADDVNFVRGHQKRLQSIARAVGAGKLDISKLSDDGRTYADANGWLDGWVEMTR